MVLAPEMDRVEPKAEVWFGDQRFVRITAGVMELAESRLEDSSHWVLLSRCS